MDALRRITNNVPDWLGRLDRLGTQIDQRQAELAALGGSSSARSIKNKGSTESLKLNDPIEPVDPVDPDARARTPAAPVTDGATRPDGRNSYQPPSPGGSATPSAVQRQTQQAVAKAQARARAHVQKRHRPGSMISADNAPTQYRSRTMIIVYYDSYVQSFFEELVKFVSASRNLMRKARMAAKVAQIRRLAEMDTPHDSEGSDGSELEPGAAGANGGDLEPLPSLRYMSTRRMGPAGLTGRYSSRTQTRESVLGGVGKDPFEDLDKKLESVQAMCEHAAHQFLRHGDCMEDVAKIQDQLSATKALADKEIERIQREDPDLLKDTSEAGKARTHRPASMRREYNYTRSKSPCLSSSMKLEVDDRLEVDDGLEAEQPVLTPAPTTMPRQTMDTPGKIEADDAPLEADDNDEGLGEMDMAPPKIQFRSTRTMRRPLKA
ncbi:hypothetical protein SODALDRAFT_269440 [Sodiomyces alkalinus F11]|uniref:Uncharacterized protein n=1 Tax=Sodiomyces alkalinus (strain CBS 110278 / VKM F-3762 / F11) TaxID=1314773 RepID=A0A3N2Q670_SODAK|nr:hypothetical protein SODALDRAFT_269440 [Sodiomyces alkalinus F11]ROT42158.1 hypothetical protein SODALDRAFT_269440 [Sodiomyces alkalinus F11]